MMLHPVHFNHTNKKPWCGIVALSALTGNPTEHSRQFLRENLMEIHPITGTARHLKGVYVSEMLSALSKLNFNVEKVTIPIPQAIRYISLARFLHEFKLKQNSLYLIVIPNHFLVTDGNKVVDSQFPQMVKLFDYPRLDDEITHCWAISESSTQDL